MSRRALAVALALTALTATACQSERGGESPLVDVPDQSTPAPDATEGIDEELIRFYTQTLDWEDCDEEFQCATATVPVDYEDPDGDTIELALLRAPATGENPIGSLLVNPGGPGASGVDYARVAGSVVTDPVRERYDIVGFDPRGVGQSAPIDCVDDATLDEYLASDASPDDDEEVAALQDGVEELVAGCESLSGDLLPHVGTPNVARDLDVLRATLGDEKLNYLGKSYGTLIGAIYADLFPDRVGRLVLDGAIDPSLSGDDMGLGQAGGFERALSAFLSWCFDQDECSVGSSEAEAQARIQGLLDQADEEPLPAGDENRPLTETLALYGLIFPLYLTADEGYPLLDDALGLALDEGDGSELLSLADIYLKRNSDGSYGDNSNEVIGVVNCLDHPEDPSTEAAQAGQAEFEAASPIFGPFLAWAGVGCAPFVDDAAATTEPVAVTATGADPILVVGTTGDPATPYEWAEALATQLSSGVLLTYESAVHTAYIAGSECIDDAVDAYLLAGTVPAEGTRCS